MNRLPLFLLLFALHLSSLEAQTPMLNNYRDLLSSARKFLLQGIYDKALEDANTARRFPDADKKEVDDLVDKIFVQVDILRKQAMEEKWKALNEAQKAENARLRADSLATRLKLKNDSLLQIQLELEKLAARGKAFNRIFQPEDYDFLFQTGLRYFKCNKVEQQRDYENARTYFVLASILQQSEELTALVEASDLGIVAENDFYQGKLEAARIKFDSICHLIEKSRVKPDYEREKLRQIDTVTQLFQTINSKDRALTNYLTFYGDWWTLPSELATFKSLKWIELNGLPGTFKRLPSVLEQLDSLEYLVLIHCDAARYLMNWSRVSHVKLLYLESNLNLYSLDSLNLLPELTRLVIKDCPALTEIRGANTLREVIINGCPQVRMDSMLQQNTHLSKLELSGVLEKFKVANAPHSLQELSIVNQEVEFKGIETFDSLAILKLDGVSTLTKQFLPPINLKTAFIARCNALDSLQNRLPSTLNHLVLYDNNSLKKLPDWKNLPQLSHLLIKKNDSLLVVPRLRNLNKTDTLYVYNNRRLRTFSLNAGAGFDWRVRPTSLKLELEYRMALGYQDFGFKYLMHYYWRQFRNEDAYSKKNIEGVVGVFNVTYYSPFTFYIGVGLGVDFSKRTMADLSVNHVNNPVWVNNFGFQLAPRYLKKDKISIDIDLYNFFVFRDYIILPSVGLTYYRTLNFSKKTRFLRASDYSTLNINLLKDIKPKKLRRNLEPADGLPNEFKQYAPESSSLRQ